MYVLNKLVDLLPKRLRPAAKAVVPALGTLVAIGAQFFVSGELDRAELVTAIVGLSSALVTFLLPNKKA